MPSRHGEADSPDIVFGDRHGASIAPNFLAVAVEAAESAGFRTERNTPYAGGYITARHGRPDRNIHALPLEIDRSGYLGPDRSEERRVGKECGSKCKSRGAASN